MRPVAVCFGTRPEVVKLAPVIQELRRRELPVVAVTTGQHREMLDQMLATFQLEPDVDLGLMTAGQSLGDLSAKAIQALGAEIARIKPSAVVVQGDTTTAFCGAVASFYNHVPVAHVEAGLRSGDMTNPFPEEANRRLVGQLARWHFTPTATARLNLLREGFDDATVEVTGNTVIDAALWVAGPRAGARRLEAADRRRVLVTMHRRESQGDAQRAISRTLARLAARGDIEIVFPVHLSPAVRASVLPELSAHDNVKLMEPLGYQDFIAELSAADLVLTDSGGLQEEAPAFNVPVLVMRDTTERPEGIEAGCALLCGTDPAAILRQANRLLDNPAVYRRMATAPNPYGDGLAAERIVTRLEQDLTVEAIGLPRFPTPGQLARVA